MPVVRALTDRRALLVLDNCEQVAAACREAVASVLAACPTVTVPGTVQDHRKAAMTFLDERRVRGQGALGLREMIEQVMR
jgi:predicted ATPase